MKLARLIAVCGVLLSAVSMLAQSRGTADDPVSGNWGFQGKTFLELTFDGKSTVSGTTVWRHGEAQPVRAAIKAGTFDPKTGALKLEGETKRADTGAAAHYVIEGKVDKDMLSGTFAVGEDKGDFTFTKMSR